MLVIELFSLMFIVQSFFIGDAMIDIYFKEENIE
jgi:hypothetical protein